MPLAVIVNRVDIDARKALPLAEAAVLEPESTPRVM